MAICVLLSTSFARKSLQYLGSALVSRLGRVRLLLDSVSAVFRALIYYQQFGLLPWWVNLQPWISPDGQPKSLRLRDGGSSGVEGNAVLAFVRQFKLVICLHPEGLARGTRELEDFKGFQRWIRPAGGGSGRCVRKHSMICYVERGVLHFLK